MRKLLLVGLLVAVAPLHAATGSCWEVADKVEQSMLEMEGQMQMLFRDAVTCQPIEGAQVQFMGEKFNSDTRDAITLPVPPDEVNTSLPLSVTKTGYMSYKDRVTVAAGSIWQTRFLLSQEIPAHSARFVLSWGEMPTDLDLHLKSDNMHISYRHMRDLQGAAKLDIDAMQGFGPETITLHRVDGRKDYRLLVHQYSSAGDIKKSHARVAVYANGALNRIIELDNAPGRCNQVAEVVHGSLSFDSKSVADC